MDDQPNPQPRPQRSAITPVLVRPIELVSFSRGQLVLREHAPNDHAPVRSVELRLRDD